MRRLLRLALNVRTLAVVLTLAVIAGGGYFWYRNSSLVKIRHVTVLGLSGPQVPRIRAALTRSALTMTTLNLNLKTLRGAVAQYREVSSLSATTHGAHAVTIYVAEQIPVATLNGAYVDGRGELLQISPVALSGPLPRLAFTPNALASSGQQVTGARAREALRVLAAAPYRFLPHVQSAAYSAAGGVVLQLRGGPQLYFGSAANANQKWLAAIAVLRNPGSAGASYINVIDPQRPAAGATTNQGSSSS